MTIDEYYADLTSTEKTSFQKVCRYLLKRTFIVRDKDDNSRKMYYFAGRNTDFLSQYLRMMGYDIVVDRENAVVMLQSRSDEIDVQVNHLRLRKIDTIILCALWTIYQDHLQKGEITKTCNITLTDLSFALEKFGYKDPIDKTSLRDTLGLFAGYNLLQVNGSIGDFDCVIALYPSLQFALSRDAFAQLAESAGERITQKGKQRESLKEIEDQDSDSDRDNPGNEDADTE